LKGKKKNLNKLLLRIFNYGISRVQPRNILKNFISVNKNCITVKDSSEKCTYQNIERIYTICVGKAAVDMAETIKKILSKSKCKIENGVVVVNKENFKKVEGFNCFVSGHPIPNQNGLKASKYIVKYLKRSTINDLVLVFISGGGSAMLPLPVKQFTLKQKIKINELLLKSGANISEINTVRKHISQIKGGNLVKICNPSKVHSFILSDVIGDDLSSIASGITVPDKTTFADVKRILIKRKIWKKISEKNRFFFQKGLTDPKLETPKKNDSIFKISKNTLIGSNYLCLKNLKEFCDKNKIRSKIWITNVDETVIDLAKIFVDNLKKNKFKKPIILISGGETTVKITGEGKGGRNQEFALQFLRKVKKEIPSLQFTILSAGTDGRDGPTNAAGAIINNDSLDQIKRKKINLSNELKNNNSYNVLQKIESLVIINGTNTNVADIQLLALT